MIPELLPMLKQTILLLLLTIGIYKLQLSASNPINIDSLRTILGNPIHDTLRVRILNIIGGYSDDSLVFYTNKALQLAKRINYINGQVMTNNNLGNHFTTIGNYPKGLAHLLESYKLLTTKSPSNRNAMCVLASNIGNVYSELDDKKRALEYYRLSLGKADTTKNFAIFNNLAYFFSKNKMLDSANFYCDLALRYTAKNQNQISAANAINIKAEILFAEMKLDSALNYFQRARKIIESFNRNESEFETQASIYKRIGLLYSSIERRDSALYYFKKSYHLAENKNLVVVKVELSKIISESFQKWGNVDSAFYYLHLNNNLQDSILSNKKRRDIYDLTFEEQLRLEDLKAQQDLERKNKKEFLQLIGLAAAIPAFFLAIMLFRKRKVSNRVINFLVTIGVLFMFEFIALVIHYFVGKITHHNLIAILVIMIFAASLLVPLHHKLEHWFKRKFSNQMQMDEI